MKRQVFDTYRFSVKTQVLYKGQWLLVKEVDWKLGVIGIHEGYISYLDVQDIRQKGEKII